MFRYDGGRTAATPHELAEQLHLQWVRQLPPRHGAFAYDRRMMHDEGYQPVVAGKTMFVGLEVNNSLLALDTQTGSERWRFYAEGPIRFAPVAWRGKVYFAAEDGCLYCLDARTGQLKWKVDGAPAERRIFNHERLTSNWPASGGPVVRDGVVFFGCGVWPIDGTYACAVNAETGEKLWTSRSGISWGYMTVIRDWVVLPSGKTPTIFDVSTGGRAPARGAYDVKNLPTAVVAAWGDAHLFNGNKAYALLRGYPTYKTYANAEHQVAIWTPVIDGDRIYGINDGILKFYRMPTADELETMKRKQLIAFGGQWWINARPHYKWSQVGEPLPLPKGVELPRDWYPRRMEIKAGSRLYASGPGAVLAIGNVADETTPRISWVGKVEGRVAAVLAADGRLFVATEPGRIYCFGPKKLEPKIHKPIEPRFIGPDEVNDQVGMVAKAILNSTGQREGYCLILGLKNGRLAEELRRQSKLRILAIDPDAKKVDQLRRKFQAAGLLDRRVVFFVGEPLSFDLPPYMANLIVSEDLRTAGPGRGRVFVERVFRALRPYGGTAFLPLRNAQHKALAKWVNEAKLSRAVVRRDGPWSLLARDGALEGAAEWTHERCDPANSLCSADRAARPPLGLLWYGGPAAEWKRTYGAFIPPGLEVVEGRYIMQGHGLLSAIDVYTGRLLWERAAPKVQYYGSYGRGLESIPEPSTGGGFVGDHEGLLDGEIHARRLSGNSLNVVSMPDGIYVTAAEKCLVLNPATGRTVKTLSIPFKDPDAKFPLCWGMVRVVGNLLVATAFDPQDIRACFPAWRTGNEKNKDRMPMRWLMVLDRKTGKLHWRRKAHSGFLNWGMAIGNGRVFCLDMVIRQVIKAYKDNGYRTGWPQPMLYALDLRTGREIWKHPVEAHATNPAYSVERDILVVPARDGVFWENGEWVERTLKPDKAQRRRRLEPAPGLMVAYRGKDGKLLWRADDGHYGEPLMLHHDSVITRRGQTFSLLTGKPIERPWPLTGQMRRWIVSHGGCNFLIGSERFVTHRTCYYDLKYQVAFGLRGMRSGCTPSILPANGVLSLFNYSHNYPSDELRSAMALVHRPRNANWIALAGRRGPAAAQQLLASKRPILRIGLNLGAPADHMGPHGTPWLRQVKASRPKTDSRGRPIPTAPTLAKVAPDGIKVFRRPAVTVRHVPEGALSWVAASGFEGVEQVTIPLVPRAARAAGAGGPRSYTVSLHFAEPHDARPGSRVFTVLLQGRPVLKDFDLVKEAGGPLRAVVKTFKGVEVKDNLTVSLEAKTGQPLLCGMEAVAEQPARAGR